MAPPTGASDSILVARRNGASLDPEYGALAPQLKSYSMENNVCRDKKTWKEKRKVHKAGKPPLGSQMIETSSFMVHPDYLNKYGTLTNGVLTKSIKCAETWVYGTVGVRGAPTQRPSLFLYPGVVAQAPRIVSQSSYLSSAAAFVGYSSPERDNYFFSQSAHIKLHSCQCTDCGKEIRSGNLSLCEKCEEKRNETCRTGSSKTRPSLKDSVKIKDRRKSTVACDPYGLMRKSRLEVKEMTDSSLFSLDLSDKRKRNASVSPLRKHGREPPNTTFETFKPKQPEREINLWKNIEDNWGNCEDEVVRRKSILECEVNAYELNKSRRKSRVDDDYEDGVSSDDFSEEPAKVDENIKILRPKLHQTDFRKISSKIEHENGRLQSENLKKMEVRLNGQRFKIFDHSNLSTRTVEGYVSDEGGGEAEAPRPPSPKRPPRRPKDKTLLGDLGFKYSKSKSKSSPNLSIKSILKKPTGIEEFCSLDQTYCGEETSSDPATSYPDNVSANPGPLTKKQSQSTLKKKKQVQFRVNNSYESLKQTPTVGEGTKESGKEESATSAKDLSNKNEEAIHRSKSCENLSYSSKTTNEFNAGNDAKTEEREGGEGKEVAKELRDSNTKGELPNKEQSQQRSFSERGILTGGETRCKDDLSLSSISSGPSKANLFNDTMALRARNSRMDTRRVFAEQNNFIEKLNLDNPSGNIKAEQGCKLPGNVITYAEFSERVDPLERNFSSTSSHKKSKLPVSTKVSGRKSPAPNPPPRLPVVGKGTKTKIPGATSIRVLVEEKENADSQSGHEKRVNGGDFASKHLDVSKDDAESEEGRTLVTLKAGVVSESTIAEGTTTSITINAKNLVDQTKSQPYRKTSVIINNFDPQDSNKVTISVRNEPTVEEVNSSTCTIIETGSNSTVIPVVSTDNKTTLIVGSSTPVTSSGSAEEIPMVFHAEQISEDLSKAEKPSQYIFSAFNLEADKNVQFMDPVEAVRRNLVPHVCGKEDSGLTLMSKIKQSRASNEQKNLKEFSQIFGNTPSEENVPLAQPAVFLLASYKNKAGKPNKQEENSSTTTSRSNSFCSTLNSSVKTSSTNTSRSSSFRSSCYKSLESDSDPGPVSLLPIVRSKFYTTSGADENTGQERDKLECEYEIRNGFKDEKKEEDGENIYETIKEEPIYDQIHMKAADEDSEDEIPPPLPTTLPPSLEESKAKSIFEGASKYDILNYLVDAKERVQEESYFSGSSTSEDVDNRRLSSLEGSERGSMDGLGGSCRLRSPSERTSTEKTERPERNKRTSAENDSGVEVSSRISHFSQTSYSSDDNSGLSSVTECRESLKVVRKSSSEVERNDSGVGSETSQTSRSKWQVDSSIREDPQHLCEDCDQAVETQVTDSGVMYAPLVCRKCSKRRNERKEIIQEIVETEEKYGRDLKIILEEFYTPMLVAGLLTADQLSAIFLNTEELLENSEQLTEKLRDTLEIALDQGDEDLLTVNIGKLFLEAGPMLHAFETYCIRQGAAALLLTSLEKEKELLRIFLRVSQMENTVLRRMNLNSFLMVPVQRVTKYPLLLARLYKVTPPQQEGRELLKEAQHNIELHLEHMNSEAKDLSATKVWRRFSTSTVSGRKTTAELEMINIKLRKMAVDVLDWNHEEVRFVMEGKLLYTQPTDSNWKKGRTIKLTPIFVLLVTLGKPNSKYKVDPPEDELTFPKKTGVREATLLLVKEKCGRYTLIREPLYLDKIIVCCETDVDEYFEVQELSTKDSFIFKAEDGERTKEWYKHLQYHAQILGSWRRRRNALANIMINGMMARTYTS